MCEDKFISSRGIGILMYGYTTAANLDSIFKIACAPKSIKEIFQKIKIDTIFQQFNSLEEALKS